jgi:hypothetical protein
MSSLSFRTRIHYQLHSLVLNPPYLRKVSAHFHNVQTGSRALTATNPLGTEVVSPGVKRQLTTHLQLIPRSTVHGSLHPLPHTSSWNSAWLVKHRNKSFYSKFPLSASSPMTSLSDVNSSRIHAYISRNIALVSDHYSVMTVKNAAFPVSEPYVPLMTTGYILLTDILYCTAFTLIPDTRCSSGSDSTAASS